MRNIRLLAHGLTHKEVLAAEQLCQNPARLLAPVRGTLGVKGSLLDDAANGIHGRLCVSLK